MITTTEASASSGVKPGTIRKAIERKKLKATKKGRDWMIKPEVFDEWMRTRQSRVRD